MPPRKAGPQNEPTLSPDRALKAIMQQLRALQKLKGRTFQEADAEKTQWEHLTQNIIEAAFGDSSSELRRFHQARSTGSYNMRGISPQQQQHNFDLQVQELEALLNALASALRLHLPEEEIKGVYEPRDEYAFYRDLSSLVQAATQEVLIVDAYLNEEVFNLYVSKVPDGVPVRTLSIKIGTNVDTVARMYGRRGHLELRSSADIHDRAVFLDQRAWVIGQSIKDAAKKEANLHDRTRRTVAYGLQKRLQPDLGRCHSRHLAMTTARPCPAFRPFLGQESSARRRTVRWPNARAAPAHARCGVRFSLHR